MRYALYYAPHVKSRLWKIGSRWLGRDAATGELLEQYQCSNIESDKIKALTATPRRYGLHATLKAPFVLADNMSEARLHSALQQFTSERAPFVCPSLELRVINKFFCLCPARQDVMLSAFANDCVMQFDTFRAPLSLEERNRRCKQQLSTQEKKYLLTWGYPYVFDCFKFHITLTDKIEDSVKRKRVGSILQDIFAPVIGTPLVMDNVSLFVEPDPGHPFSNVKHYFMGQAY